MGELIAGLFGLVFALVCFAAGLIVTGAVIALAGDVLGLWDVVTWL
jgi:hypothetical protein